MAYYEDLEQYNAGYDDDYDTDYSDGSGSGNMSKVLLAAAVGAAAGAVIGLLLAPDKGTNTVTSLRSGASRYSHQLEDAFRRYLDKVETLVGRSGAGTTLRLRGDWNTVKGQLRSQYGNLTDDDLTYVEGQEDQLIGSIQRRLGKTKREVVQLLNNLS